MMHEMGIASSVLDAVQDEMRRYPEHRATKVGLRIGRLRGSRSGIIAVLS